MEETFFEIAAMVALAIEATVVLILAVASLRTLVSMTRMVLMRRSALAIRRDVWLNFGAAIALALEFSLAADIIRSAIAPTWDAIGKLAAIAVIRILLNLFLMRDIESLKDTGGEKDGE
jgi:uncharacterized membrane protein